MCMCTSHTLFSFIIVRFTGVKKNPSATINTMHQKKSSEVSVDCVCKKKSIVNDVDYWTGDGIQEVRKHSRRQYNLTTLTFYTFSIFYTFYILSPTSFFQSYPIRKRLHFVHIPAGVIVCVRVHVCVFVGSCLATVFIGNLSAGGGSS